MVQPIQYGIQAPSAFESLVSGLRLGTSLQQIQLQREQQMAAMQQAQEKAEAERQRQARLQMLRGKSFSQWTPDDVLSASDLLPKESLTFLKGQMDQMSTEERRARALTLGQLGSVALMGDAERTSAAFDERIEAETNPREKEALRAQKQIALTRPEDLAKMYAVMLPAMGDEGKQVADNLLKVRGLETEKPAAEPEKIRILRAAGLEPTLENIGKLAAAERAQQPDEAMMQVLGIPRTPEGYRQFKELQSVDRGPLVQNILPGEPGGKAALEKLDVPRAQEFAQNAASARTFADISKTIADLLRGKGSGVVVNLTTDMMSKLGLPSSTVSARDLANSLAVRGATLVRVPGSGSTTDLEFKAYLSAFPSLQSSEAGREIMAKYADAIAKRSARLADHARQLIRQDKFSEEEIARFDNSLGPVLGKDFYDAIGDRRTGAGNSPPSQPSSSGRARTVDDLVQQYRSR